MVHLLCDSTTSPSKCNVYLVAYIHYFTTFFLQQKQRRRRPPIDRSMIGLPQNFQHTAHIGSSDVAMGTRHLVALQNHMQSKGGYDTAVPIEDSASRQTPTVTVT